MEKQPDSSTKVLQKRIEAMEQKLRSFEQGMRALQVLFLYSLPQGDRWS